MLRILDRADDAALRAATSAVSAAAGSCGLTWPFFLLAWRAAFWGPLFVFAAAAAAWQGTWLSYAALAAAAVMGEASRKQCGRLWAESRREWTPAMFSRYALEAMAKRDAMGGFRLLSGFHAAVLCALAPVAVLSGSGLALPLCAALYLACVIAAGGWIEAAMPPLPGTGETEPAAVPGLA